MPLAIISHEGSRSGIVGLVLGVAGRMIVCPGHPGIGNNAGNCRAYRARRDCSANITAGAAVIRPAETAIPAPEILPAIPDPSAAENPSTAARAAAPGALALLNFLDPGQARLGRGRCCDHACGENWSRRKYCRWRHGERGNDKRTAEGCCI